MFRARDPWAALAVACLAASCGEPVRVDGRTLDEHLARIDAMAASLRGPLVREIGAFGPAGDAAIPRLTDWLRNDPALRADAAHALGAVGTAAAQRALLDALSNADVPPDAVAPAAEAAIGCVPADTLAGALRSLVAFAPARAARLVVNDRVFAAVLADPDLRRDIVVALSERLDALDRRAQDATLRRVPELGDRATGHEQLLAHAIDAGVATAAAIEALAGIDTPAAFEVLAARVREPFRGEIAALLTAVARAGDGVPERAAAVIDRAATARDPQVRTARLEALAVLARGAPEIRPAVASALAAALEDPNPAVEEAARTTSAGLVADSILDADTTARAWTRVAAETTDADRARRIASALGSGLLPAEAAVPALRGLGESAPPAVARAAERALSSFDDPAARAARIAILARADGREAVRRATMWAREPTTTFDDLVRAATELARVRPTPAFMTALLEEADRKANADDASARIGLWSELLADDRADRGTRIAAARRLLAEAPARAVLTVSVGDRTVSLRLFVDRATRATRPAELAPDRGALYVFPRLERLTLPVEGLTAAREVVLFGDAMDPIGRGSLHPAGTPFEAAAVRAAAVLPVGCPGDAEVRGLDPELVHALGR